MLSGHITMRYWKYSNISTTTNLNLQLVSPAAAPEGGGEAIRHPAFCRTID